MRVLLTGASGFIGGPLARRLVSEGHDVAATVRKVSDLSRLHDLRNRIRFINIDEDGIGGISRLPHQPEVLLHLATCYGRRGETKDEIYRANVVFPMKLLQAVAGIERFTFVNTDTYWPENYSALPEYAFSKKQFLISGREFAEKIGMRFVNLRLQHVFGPGDTADKFVPSLVKNCLANLPEIPMTKGTQKRDFVFIDDVISAYLHVMGSLEKLPVGYVEMDVGTGVSIPVRDFAMKVCSAAASTSKLKFGAIRQRKDEIPDSAADISALRSLGWQPRVGLEEGIAITVRSLASADSNRW